MAKGAAVWFAQGLLDLGNKVHNLGSDVLKLGIVTSATIPSYSTAGPHWGGTGTTNFASSQVATATSYTGPITLAGKTWVLATNSPTLRANNISVAADAGGFTNGYYGIIYNDTDPNKRALGFVDLGGGSAVSITSASLSIDWQGTTNDILAFTDAVAAPPSNVPIDNLLPNTWYEYTSSQLNSVNPAPDYASQFTATYTVGSLTATVTAGTAKAGQLLSRVSGAAITFATGTVIRSIAGSTITLNLAPSGTSGSVVTNGKACFIGTTGLPAIMDAWSGGTYDTKRDLLYVWGGGHIDYYGNEIYAFGPLTSANPTWTRITEPSINIPDVVLQNPSIGVLNISYYSNNNIIADPAARHSYTKFHYDPVNDRIMSLSARDNSSVDSLDLATLPVPAQVAVWRSDWPSSVNGSGHDAGCYNPNDQCFYLKPSDLSVQIEKFDPNANGGAGQWTSVGGLGAATEGYNMAVDTKRNRIVAIGYRGNNGVPGNNPCFVYDCTTHVRTNFTSTGDPNGITLETLNGPGFIYDPVGDRFIGWHSGATVYALDPVTFNWTAINADPSNTVVPVSTSRTYKRMSYVPSKHGFVVVCTTTSDVFFYKLDSTAPALVPITTVDLVNNSASMTTNVPFTFGHVFKTGDIVSGNTVIAKDSLGTIVPIQVDNKATHADGSLRHAVISSSIASISLGATKTLTLYSQPAGAAGTPLTVANVLATAFDAVVTVVISGVTYSASARTIFGAFTPLVWLSGQTCTEFIIHGPVRDASNNPHPHLEAYFHVRAYGPAPIQTIRVDVILENNWSYVANPTQFDYNMNITVAGVSVYTNASVRHYHHARWRKQFWWNSTQIPTTDVKFNVPYLISTKAVPNYDQSIVLSQTGLNNLATAWSNGLTTTNADGYNHRTDIMGQGVTNPDMPAVGGRPELGILPGWTVQYILSMDSRAKQTCLGEGDLAGSFPMHYRDELTGYPIDMKVYNYAQIWTSSRVSAGGSFGPSGPSGITKDWTFPAILAGGTGEVGGPFTLDVNNGAAHRPSFGYVPYLVTGDYYYLEEMQFWNTLTLACTHYTNRTWSGLQGLLRWTETRSNAWGIRDYGQVAYATPDAHPKKAYWQSLLNDSISYYQQKLVNDNPNQLGILQITNSFQQDNIIYDPEHMFVCSNDGAGNILLASKAHGKAANDAIVFATASTGGGFVSGQSTTMPGNMTSGTTYYVAATNLTADQFSISATAGGALIPFSTTGYCLSVFSNNGYSTWQDSFFTSMWGHLLDLGFTAVQPIFNWKAKLPVGLMTTPGFCVMDAAPYNIQVRDKNSGAIYTSLVQSWNAAYGSLIDTKPTSSTFNQFYRDQTCGTTAQATWKHNVYGSPSTPGLDLSDPEHYAANLQTVLAYCVDNGITNAATAWSTFVSSTINSNYTTEPQFAIVPR